MKARTPAYITTFEFSCYDTEAFKLRFVEVLRKALRNPRGIRVRGRLGENNPNADLYRRGGLLHRPSSQDIRVEHAASIDVYYKS